MQTLLGLNGSTLPNADLETGIRAAANAGFALYEPRIPALEKCASRAQGRAARRLLGDSRLAWLPLNALEDVFTLPEAELSSRAEKVFTLAAHFGVSRVILVPGRCEGEPLPFDNAVAQLKRLKKQARDVGLALLYELIGFPVHHFPTLQKADRVAKAAGIPLTLDTFHLAVSRTPADAVASLPDKAIGHVHLSDAIMENKTPETIEDGDRVLPGEGGLDLAGLLSGIRRSGYTGAVSVEVFHPKYGDENPEAVARDAHARATAVLAEAGYPP